MNVVTFCSFKGGTAKTSTSLHLAACLAKFHKKRVLVVDFDPQANLSIGLNFGPDSLLTLVPVLQGQSEIKDVIQKTDIPNLSIICANALLDQIEKTVPLSSDPYAFQRLNWALNDKNIEEQFDYCFIDTPPSLGWLTQSAFIASRYSVVCSIPEAFSIIALRKLREFHELMKRDMSKNGRDIDVLGVVLSFWDERGATNQDFIDEIDRSFPNKTFNTKIRRDVAVSRAVLQGKPVIDVEPNSRGSEDYKNLTTEFISHFEKSPKNKLKSLIKEKTQV